ncbi:MAG: PilZ domain-containing protein [Terriglobia bacterium]
MSKRRIPEKPFRVKFKIARYGFTDFHHFVQRFVNETGWKIIDVNENAQTYVFDNRWGMTLFVHGDINLFTPILPREKAGDVYDIIDVLLKLEVRIGENCEVTSQYADAEPGAPVGILQSIPPEFFCAAAIILFVIANTFQYAFRETISLPLLLAFELASFVFAAIFGYALHYSYARNRDLFQESLVEVGMEKAHREFLSNDDIKKKMKQPHELAPIDLVNEMKFPLENIMAYTRFYKSHTRPNSQHWRDLMEIVEQASRMREVMNRVETSFQSTLPDDPMTSRGEESHLFRQFPRLLDLVPAEIRGVDLLGETFKHSCHTLNISATGACLLIPENLVAIGSILEVHFEALTTKGLVRWVMQGKSGGLMFAGVEFSEAIDLSQIRIPSRQEEPPSANVAH